MHEALKALHGAMLGNVYLQICMQLTVSKQGYTYLRLASKIR